MSISLQQAIKTEKLRGQEPAKPLRFLQKIEKPVPRPPTPAVQVPDQVGKMLGWGWVCLLCGCLCLGA